MRGRSRATHDVPLTVVGCDFRTASTQFREALVCTQETRSAMAAAIRKTDPDAGFVALETCNRVEWITASESPEWMAEILRARMLSRWSEMFPPGTSIPAPAVHVGDAAALHVFRVSVGMESLAAGEAQIAGQLQSALRRSVEEKTGAAILGRLASAAGRLAKAAFHLGYRANRHHGIHGLAAKWAAARVAEPGGGLVLVAGMGRIGRKAADLADREPGCRVVRFNRTAPAGNKSGWLPLSELASFASGAAALVVATGSLSPVIGPGDLDLCGREVPLPILDIGIPRQVDSDARNHPMVEYRDVDHLAEMEQSMVDPATEASVQSAMCAELARFRRFCRERGMVSLLEKIHDGRRRLVHERVPAFIDSELPTMDESQRKALEGALSRFILDYVEEIHDALHRVLDRHWSKT